MKLLTSVFFLLISSHCLADIHVHLYMKISNNFDVINIRKKGMRMQLSKDPDIEIQVPVSRIIDTTLTLAGEGFYQIDDAMKGHLLYVEDGDNIELTMQANASAYESLHKQDGKVIWVLNNLSAQGEHRGNYIFFDDYFTRIHYLVKFLTDKKQSLTHFRERCDSAYYAGVNLLEVYHQQRLISETFYLAAKQEIDANYMSWICEPLSVYKKEQLPADFLHLVNRMSFTDSAYALQSGMYIQAADLMVYYIYNDFNVGESYSNLIAEYQIKKDSFSGIVRDQLLAWSMEDYANKNYPCYDSIYNDFLQVCHNRIIRWRTQRKVEQLQASSPKKNTDISFAAALSLNYVQDLSGNRKVLKDVLSDTLINVIDCWATWCGPCRAQMPYAHEMEKKYKGKVKFIYLSFDKENFAWTTFMENKKLPANNQFIIDNAFSNPFAVYFNIEAIPRYILISPDGKKELNRRLPLPINKEDFEKEIAKHLSR